MPISAAAAAALNVTNVSTPVTVSDAAANVLSNLTALQALAAAAKLASIMLTDSATPSLALTAAQVVTGAQALLKITTSYTINVSGTVTVAAVTALNATLATKLSPALALTDSLAAVGSNLAALQTLAAAGRIASITLTDSGTPNLTLTGPNLVIYAATLMKIGGSFTLTLSGSASAAQANAANPALVAKLTSGFAVSDTAANVATYIAGLQTRFAAGKLASIAMTDGGTPALTLTIAQVAADIGALGKITGNYTINASGTATAAQAAALTSAVAAKLSAGLAVSDTAANVMASIAGLQVVAAAGKLASVTLTNGGTPSLSMTAAQLIADAQALLKIAGSFTIAVTGVASATQAAGVNATLRGKLSASLSVTDTAANVTANLGGLQSMVAAAKLASIALSDSGTPVLTLTGAQLGAASAVLLKITGSFALHISGALTAAQAAAMGSILAAKLNAAVTVSDTMANVGSNLSALQAIAAAGRLASITLTDGSTPTLTLSAPALVQNAAALVRIASPFDITLSGTASAAQVSAANPNLVAKLTSGFVVTDTAANVANYLTQLQARAAAGKLVSVTLTDAGTPTISVTSANLVAASAALAAIGGTWNLSVSSGTLTVAQALALPNGLAAHLTGGLGVSDSAANVAGGLDGLQTLAAAGKLTGIALSDGGTPTLTVPVTTLLTDAQALGLVGGSWHLAISSASLTCAQALAIGGTLAGHLTGPVAVADSSAAVAANLAGLQAMSSAISGVTLTDTPASVAVTADQLWHDAAILNLIIAGGVSLSGSGSGASAAASSHLASAPSYTGTLSFTDTAANVAAYLDNLQSLASAGHLGTIILSNGGTPALSITAARLVSDTGALAAIGGAYTISIASGSVTVAQALAIGNTLLAKLNATLPVRDTSTNVLNNLDALQNRAAALGSVSFSSGATTLSMTGTRAVSVIGVLSVLSGVTVTISGTVTAAQAAAISGSNLPAHLLTGPVVSDTAANIVSALGGLASLAAVNKLGSITVSDAGTLTLTAQQLSEDVPVLRKITSAATIAVSTPLTAAQAAGISSVLIARLSSSLAVSDSAANVLANLDALQALASGGHLGSVALNDGGTPVLSVTGDQMYSDADVLAVISGTYQLEILGGITADQAASFGATTGRLATGVYVVDSAANVQADIASLEALAAAGKLASITFTDAGTPTLTLSGAAFSTGSDALLTIVGGFAITLSSALTVAQLQAADGNGLLPYVDAAVAVTDTAAHIAGAIDALHGLGSTVGAITLTDVSPSLALSSQQFVTDSDVLLKIGGVYAIGLSGSLTVAQAEAAAGNGLLALVTGGAVITDTVTNVQAALDALLPLHADLSGIILTDGGTPTVSVSAARLVADAAILSLIGGTWRLAVSSGTVTVAQAQALPSPVTAHLTAGLTVTGSAAAVTAALDGLQSFGIVIECVSLTDSGTPSLSLSASQLIADAPLLLKIGGSFGLAVTGSATAQQAVTIDSNLRVRISGGLQVADSAASVTAYLGGLQTLAAASALAGIMLTDAGIPNVTVDAATLVADQAALAAIAGSYALTVATGSLSAAQAANLYSQVAAKLATGLTVQDSAANVVSHLAGLQAGQSHIAAVSLTDDTPVLSLTANQVVADAAILQKISGGFAITLSGSLTVAQAEAAAAEGLLARVSGGAAILDTASDVQAALDQLETLSPTSASSRCRTQARRPSLWIRRRCSTTRMRLR